jgi:hypothetical protein
MNFYWFERIGKVDSNSVRKRSYELAGYGFSGMLLPYGPLWGDNFTRVSRAMDPNLKFKYMIAIRPHTISGQYLAMLCSSIGEISKNRIMINFVAGAVQDHEKDFGGIFGDITDHSSPLERKIYLCEYVDMFTALVNDKSYKPDILISGQSKEILSSVDKNKATSIIGYQYYKKDNLLLAPGRKTMVAIVPVIRDTEQELEEFKQGIKKQSADITFLTPQQFKDLLNEFRQNGVEDLLVHRHEDDDMYQRIYDLVKEVSS